MQGGPAIAANVMTVSRARPRACARLVVPNAIPCDGDRVLDVGCATGSLSFALARIRECFRPSLALIWLKDTLRLRPW
jgi:precorrin-6B methylase 2